MAYLWLKAFHIAAVMVWIGGLLVSSAAVTAVQASSTTTFAAIRRWERRVTSPAMLLVWILGLALAALADWFPSAWLIVKLVIVLALSALHGMLTGTLRRLADGVDHRPPAVLRLAAPAVVLAVAAVVLLAVVKPFGA